MVARTLVVPDIDAGRAFVEALDTAKLPIQAALWLYNSELDRWRLTLATRLVDRLGPLETYRRLNEVWEGLPEDVRQTLGEYSVISPADVLIRALSKTIQTGPEISGIRMSKNVVDRVYIDDAYIYRVNTKPNS